jgi:cupin 2 domain-containing protein
MNNLLLNVPINRQDEQFEDLLQGGNFRVERIVSNGQATPPGEWCDQSTDEWVVVLAGAARLTVEKPDHVYEMQPGDYVNIPAHQRHRVDWTDPDNSTVWLAIHYRPREKAEATTDLTG